MGQQISGCLELRGIGKAEIVWWLKKGRDPCSKENVQCPECIAVSVCWL